MLGRTHLMTLPIPLHSHAFANFNLLATLSDHIKPLFVNNLFTCHLQFAVKGASLQSYRMIFQGVGLFINIFLAAPTGLYYLTS